MRVDIFTIKYKLFNMELLDVMLKRCSTREFSKKAVTKEELDKILASALLAPTSMNRQPCNFMVVENKDILEKLSKSKDHGSSFVKNADKAIVVVVDSLIADTWCEDSSIALTFMHLMASNLGIGSCWVQIHLRSKNGRDSEKIVRDILKIDNHYRIVGLLALGNYKEIPNSKTLNDLDKSKIHFFI